MERCLIAFHQVAEMAKSRNPTSKKSAYYFSVYLSLLRPNSLSRPSCRTVEGVFSVKLAKYHLWEYRPELKYVRLRSWFPLRGIRSMQMGLPSVSKTKHYGVISYLSVSLCKVLGWVAKCENCINHFQPTKPARKRKTKKRQ